MPIYANGNIPESRMIQFGSGYNKIDGNWKWLLPAATYARHLKLQRLSEKRAGKKVQPTDGWACYRPRWAQTAIRAYYASIGQPLMAAYPGTSSHGGVWEGQDTAAVDYNWGPIYGWNRDAWFEDVRAAGLHPGLISPSRNSTYPDEPWHVIDLDPWGAVPAGSESTGEWDEMASKDEIKAAVREALVEARYGTGNRNLFDLGNDARGFAARAATAAEAGTAEKVWSSDLIALDKDGNPVRNADGSYKTFKAWGFASSTNAQVTPGAEATEG